MFRTDHLQWADRIVNMLEGKLQLSDQDACSDRDCTLGKWYFGKAKEFYDEMPEYQVIDVPHMQLHEIVQKTVKAFDQGEIELVHGNLMKIERLSHEVVDLLVRFENAITENDPAQALPKVDDIHPEYPLHLEASLPGSNGQY